MAARLPPARQRCEAPTSLARAALLAKHVRHEARLSAAATHRGGAEPRVHALRRWSSWPPSTAHCSGSSPYSWLGSWRRVGLLVRRVGARGGQIVCFWVKEEKEAECAAIICLFSIFEYIHMLYTICINFSYQNNRYSVEYP